MGTREEKQLVVQELVEKLRSNRGAVLTDYRGIGVAKDTDLRAKLRKAGVEYRVVKNTLLQRAAEAAGIEGLDKYLEGPTAIAMSVDSVAPAKALSEWVKANKMLEIKGGIYEGKVFDQAGVAAIAVLPSREIMLSSVLGTILAPLSAFATVVDAIRKQKEEQ
ncbi:MAG: 50S ribosomal protein L10 [Bacillota bacterium]|nr:MAG: 50S ribosomal protein L10 [Bacillota bacterium]MBS3949973.1 50S ribosomal protein L10 [Peptococcaceae bacterium]